MRSIVLNFSQIDTKDRLTVDHYLSEDLITIKKLERSLFSLVPLGDLATIKGGKRLPPKAHYSVSGIPYIRVVDIGDYEINLDNAVYLSDELHKKIKHYQLQKNDIGIVIVGATIGKTAIFRLPVNPCNFNENLARITAQHQKLNPDFLLAYLQSSFGQAYISWLTGGSAQAKLSLERIAKIRVPVPPRSIQDQIAQVMQEAYGDRQKKLEESENLLKGIDDFVLNQTGIDLAKSKRKKSFIIPVSQLIGQRFDVESASNNFRVEDYPNVSWIALRDIANLPTTAKIASRQPDKTFTYIGMPDVDNIYGEVDAQELLGKDIKANKVVIRGNDVVFARIEPCVYNLKIALIPADIEEALGSTELLIARPKSHVVPSFLLWILRSDLIQHQIAGKVTGTTGRRRLPNSVFASLQIPQVPLNLQKNIADEAARRRDQAKQLRSQAEAVVAAAKARVERMILGEKEIDKD